MIYFNNYAYLHSCIFIYLLKTGNQLCSLLWNLLHRGLLLYILLRASFFKILRFGGYVLDCLWRLICLIDRIRSLCDKVGHVWGLCGHHGQRNLYSRVTAYTQLAHGLVGALKKLKVWKVIFGNQPAVVLLLTTSLRISISILWNLFLMRFNTTLPCHLQIR